VASHSDLCYMTAIQLANGIRNRLFSPVEVTRAILDRIEQVQPKLNAYVTILADRAMEDASRAERSVIGGAPLGLLHGVPFSLKDLTPTKGIRTTYGSRAFENYVPDENSIVADRLLSAGGILLGKTTTPEFGNKGVTESPLLGVSRNPWRLTHITGGSSGGSAAAVASGLGPIAEGSDGAGSIRIPASCCGVVGMKASTGRVPSYPKYTVFEWHSHQGPIARTVGDTALMLTVMAGPDDRFPYSISESGIDYVKAIEGASVRGLKVAYSQDLGLGPVDPEVTYCTDRAASVFSEDLGAIVEPATPPVQHPEKAMLDIWDTIFTATLLDQVLPRVPEDEVDPALLAIAERGNNLTAVEFYRSAFVFRSNFYLAMMRFFERYDLMITPTLAVPPFEHPGWVAGPSHICGQKRSEILGWLLTYPFNMTGQPAITVPCGFSKDGLPIGLQIVGRRNADIAVLRAAAAYEAAAPWADKRPALD
jgi:aspartyl-tRNA(Asn)/glutamyl-tRNA(Gln) amidotransferase subunit A